MNDGTDASSNESSYQAFIGPAIVVEIRTYVTLCIDQKQKKQKQHQKRATFDFQLKDTQVKC